jgi:antitoxin component of RelBE/YafQ-DinJ toxin-antitoxin module
MDRFSQDRLAQTGLQHVGKHKINGTAEEAFQIFLQAHVSVKSIPFELDQEVKVAREIPFASRYGAKKAELADAKSPNGDAVFFQHLQHLVTRAVHSNPSIQQMEPSGTQIYLLGPAVRTPPLPKMAA